MKTEIRCQQMTPEDALHLLHKAGCPPDVIAHARAVAEYAREIAEQYNERHRNHTGADIELVIAGALFHDTGRARSNGIDHAVAGAAIAHAFCPDTRIVRIIRVEILTHIANSYFCVHPSTAHADRADSTIALNKMTFYEVLSCN